MEDVEEFDEIQKLPQRAFSKLDFRGRVAFFEAILKPTEDPINLTTFED